MIAANQLNLVKFEIPSAAWVPTLPVIWLALTGPEECAAAESLLQSKEAEGYHLKYAFVHHVEYQDCEFWRGLFIFEPGKPTEAGELRIDFYDEEDGPPGLALFNRSIASIPTMGIDDDEPTVWHVIYRG